MGKDLGVYFLGIVGTTCTLLIHTLSSTSTRLIVFFGLVLTYCTLVYGLSYFTRFAVNFFNQFQRMPEQYRQGLQEVIIETNTAESRQPVIQETNTQTIATQPQQLTIEKPVPLITIPLSKSSFFAAPPPPRMVDATLPSPAPVPEQPPEKLKYA